VFLDFLIQYNDYCMSSLLTVATINILFSVCALVITGPVIRIDGTQHFRKDYVALIFFLCRYGPIF